MVIFAHTTIHYNQPGASECHAKPDHSTVVYIAEEQEQAGFRTGRNTVQILIAEKHRDMDKKVYDCFVDYRVFDSMV